ncbi:MAG: hypothetical protein HY815_28135 [Candidatus Riflebacteria bacterium]|nr:hypothetical protein [Candidatus Riflebacteria bacterium]
MNCPAALALVLGLSLLTPIVAQPDRDSPPRFTADLDNDGRQETIELRSCARTDLGDFYQLVVLDADGKTIWSGPTGRDTANPLIFGSWDFGVTLPQVAGDIDGDGFVELVGPAPQSDVSAPSYRVFRWKGLGFKLVRDEHLIEDPPNSGYYPWEKKGAGQGRWISRFLKVDGGTVTVAVLEYGSGEPGTSLMGKAVVASVPTGFRLKSWIEPLKAAGGAPAGADEPPATGGSGSVRPGGGDEKTSESTPTEGAPPSLPSASGEAPPIEAPPAPASSAPSYRARLSAHDHHNSKGSRLTKVADILRQDRANFHLYGKRDPEDETDPKFRDLKERAEIEQQPIRCSQGGDWKERIIEGTPLVRVTIGHESLSVEILER